MQCREPEVNLYSPQDNSFGTPARKKKLMILLEKLVGQMLAVLLGFLSIMVMNLNMFIKMTIILPSFSPMNVLQISQRLTKKILAWD